MVTATIETQSLMDEPEVIDAVVPHRWTREEYERMVDAGAFEGMRIELVDGVIYEMTPQSSPHAGLTTIIAELLGEVFPRSGHVIRQHSPLALAESSPEPDVAVVPLDPTGKQYLSSHPTSAFLVVEVADSSLYHDRKRKSAMYAEAGIPEYWIVNLKTNRLEILREPRRKSYRSRTLLGAGDSISPVACPEATIPVSKLFPE